MDEKAQMQAIVDKLFGVPPETLPHLTAFDEPWRSIYRRVRRVGDFQEAELSIVRATQGRVDQYGLVTDLVNMLPPGDTFAAYPSLHEISGQFSSVDWLWPSWIPRGMLTLFGAAPGAGKSLVALDLARRVIHGEPFPDGAPPADVAPSADGGGDPCPGRRVLIVDAEGAPSLLNQRARAWGIDSRRLFLMLAPDRGLIDLAHPEQQELFCEMCRTLEPALVVVDSLAAATARGETSLEAARAILGFLSNVAREGNLALLLIHHLRKRASSRRGATALGRAAPARHVAADDLRGSSHISAAARSVMALSVVGAVPGVPPEPEEARPASPDSPQGAGAQPGTSLNGPRRLEIVKTNLCCHPPPLGVIFEGENVPVPTLRYTEYVEPTPEPTRTDLCAGWLFRYLDAVGEPVKPAAAVREAAKQGYSRNTLYRARKLLGGMVVDLGTGPRDPHKRWALAAEPSPPTEANGNLRDRERGPLL